jgi:hypothetical protein
VAVQPNSRAIVAVAINFFIMDLSPFTFCTDVVCATPGPVQPVARRMEGQSP